MEVVPSDCRPICTEQLATYCTLGSCYIVLTGVSIACLLKLRQLNKREHQRIFHLLVIAACTVRLVDLALHAASNLRPSINDAYVEKPNEARFLFFLLGSLPSYLFLNCYGILLLLCTTIYLVAMMREQAAVQRARRVFKATFVVIYTVAAAFYLVEVADLVLRVQNKARADLFAMVKNVHLYFLSLCYLLGVILFLWLCGRLFCRLRHASKMHGTNDLAMRLLFKTGLLTIVVSVCFAVRTVLTAADTVMDLDQRWYMVLLYYLLCEILPMSLICYTYAQRESRLRPNAGYAERVRLIQ